MMAENITLTEEMRDEMFKYMLLKLSMKTAFPETTGPSYMKRTDSTTGIMDTL